MTRDSPRIDRSVLIELSVTDALKRKGRHWDLVYAEVDGVRPNAEIPPNSWEQLPKLCVALGERLLSRESILKHDHASRLVLQTAMDFIWISGFTLVGSRIEHGPHLIAPYIRRHLEKTDTDTGRFDMKLLESHNQWCDCAREIGSVEETSPIYFAIAAESTMEIAALFLDLGLEQGLLPTFPRPDEELSAAFNI